MPEPVTPDAIGIQNFIQRWERSGAAERANYTMFLTELAALLGVPGPEPTRPEDHDNAYVFERNVRMPDGDGAFTTGRIDLYKRGCFVLEAKQGSTSDDGPTLFVPETPARTRRGTAVRGTAHWDAAMKKAKGQAEQYVRSLPAEEGNPPFILVVDVGHVIEMYADFSRLGKTYTQVPRRAGPGRPLRPRHPRQTRHSRRGLRTIQRCEGRSGCRIAGDAGGAGSSQAGGWGATCGVKAGERAVFP